MSANTWATWIGDAEKCLKDAADLLEKREWTRGAEKMVLARANMDMAIAYVTSRHPMGIPVPYGEVQEK